MFNYIPTRRKHSPTQITRKIFDSLVRLPQVSNKTLRDAELFSAQVADIRTFARVDAHVPDVGVRGVQAFAAEFAVVVDAAVDNYFCGVDSVLVDFRALATFRLFRLAGSRFWGICRRNSNRTVVKVVNN